MTTRKVVKDALPKGMNRGAAEDQRAEKMGELSHYKRNLGKTICSSVTGFATATYLCGACGWINTLPLTTQACEIEAPCAGCGTDTTQERIRLHQ